jgi:hypothetical protein
VNAKASSTTLSTIIDFSVQHVALFSLSLPPHTTLFQGHLHGNDGKRYRTLCDITCKQRVKQFVMYERGWRSEEKKVSFDKEPFVFAPAMCVSECMFEGSSCHENVRITALPFVML